MIRYTFFIDFFNLLRMDIKNKTEKELGGIEISTD